MVCRLVAEGTLVAGEWRVSMCFRSSSRPEITNSASRMIPIVKMVTARA